MRRFALRALLALGLSLGIMATGLIITSAAAPAGPRTVVLNHQSGQLTPETCQSLLIDPVKSYLANNSSPIRSADGTDITAQMQAVAAASASDPLCQWSLSVTTEAPAQPTALARFFGARTTYACTQDPSDWPYVCGGWRHLHWSTGSFNQIWEDINYFGMWDDWCTNGDHLSYTTGSWPAYVTGTNFGGWDPQYACPGNAAEHQFWYAPWEFPWWHFDFYTRLYVHAFWGNTVAQYCQWGNWSCVNWRPW